MPIIAVAGAVAGASALAAGGLTVWGTISAIGAVVGGIGALTGNEDMMKIGGIAGIAGGVGAYASGQGWLASGGANSALNDTGGNIGAMLDAPAPGVSEVGANGTATWDAMGFDSAEAMTAATGGLDSGITQNIATNGLFDSANPTDQRLAAGTQTSPLGNDPTSITNPAIAVNGNTNAPAPPGQGGILGTLKSFSKFLDENKTLAKMGGDFIGGMFDDEKKARTELYQARADAERQQLLNGSAIPKLGLKLKPQETIFRPGTPTYNAPRPGGLFYAK